MRCGSSCHIHLGSLGFLLLFLFLLRPPRFDDDDDIDGMHCNRIWLIYSPWLSLLVALVLAVAVIQKKKREMAYAGPCSTARPGPPAHNHQCVCFSGGFGATREIGRLKNLGRPSQLDVRLASAQVNLCPVHCCVLLMLMAIRITVIATILFLFPAAAAAVAVTQFSVWMLLILYCCCCV